MIRILPALLATLTFGGCGVGLYYEYEPYGYGSYGYYVYTDPLVFYYEDHYMDEVYFETPALEPGCRIYVDITGHPGAWVRYDEREMALYDVDYGANDTDYTFISLEYGRHEFSVETDGSYGRIETYYRCD